MSLDDIDTLLELPNIPVQISMAYLTGENASPFTRSYFNEDSLHYLQQCYSAFIPDLNPGDVPQLFDCYSTVYLWGDRIDSEKSKRKRCKIILANWVGSNGKIVTTCSSLDTCPGTVESKGSL